MNETKINTIEHAPFIEHKISDERDAGITELLRAKNILDLLLSEAGLFCYTQEGAEKELSAEYFMSQYEIIAQALETTRHHIEQAAKLL